MQPTLHLSIPVRNMEEARDFCVLTLGCQAARPRKDHTDQWFPAVQISLPDRTTRWHRPRRGV